MITPVIQVAKGERQEVRAFQDQVKGHRALGVRPFVADPLDGQEHPPAVEQNDALLAEYNAVLESISTAETTCANSINGLLTGMCAAPLVPVTAEQLDSLDGPMPWGSPSKEAEGVQQSIQKGFDNFVGGTFEGIKALAGFDPVTGDWSAWNIVTTLGGTADFLVSTAALTLTVPASWLLKETTGKSELTDFLDDRINLAATGWGGMVGWDHQAALAGGDGWAKWKEDGVFVVDYKIDDGDWKKKEYENER
ncbi:MAG: hypothetical protein ACTIA6_09785 [Pseudoclavibacter sp.]